MEPEVAGQRALFDYGALDAETRIVLQQRAGEIKSIAKRMASDVVEIGHKLADVKQRLANGKFNEWLSAELGWSERTAYNFCAVYSRFGAANFAIENVAVSALYLLAAPSTPAEAVEVARQIADGGEEVTHGVAKEIVRQAKAREPKQKELIEEPEAEVEEDGADETASTAEPEEPRRPMDQLVATVKRFSGRIVGSTLVNQGFTFDQLTEALSRKLIEKRDSAYLWYVEPVQDAEATPRAESAQKRPPVKTPATSDHFAAWYKTRVEITITLMPGGDGATRKVMHSVRAGEGMPFVELTAGEDDLVGSLPTTTLGLFEKAYEAFAKKPAARPAAKPAKKPITKSKPAAKKPAAKTKAKGGKK
jgi:hypothetical protein